ncbi:MAG: HAD-IC family P-type ATPase [Planctomycetota bacterium]
MTHAREWHACSAEDALQALDTTRAGLDPTERAARLARDGPNRLREEREPGLLLRVVRQFRSPLVLLLLCAIGFALWVGEWIDAGAILAIVILNAAIGVVQERHAANAIAGLRRASAPRARIREQGRSRTVEAENLVVGDIVELESGDVVPADLRLLDAAALRCSEALLTGESVPVTKSVGPIAVTAPLAERSPMLFAGTHVVAGSALGVVVATGMGTELGSIAGMLESAGSQRTTPLQQRLAAIGRNLAIGAAAIVVLLLLLGLARGVSPDDMLLTAIGLAVAAVPEGLPAVVTIALAVGVVRMARRRAIVRRLASVETLGSADVVCTDKTGTLTRGEMVVQRLWVDARSFAVRGEGYAPSGSVVDDVGATASSDLLLDLAESITVCNEARLVEADGHWHVVGDPTEGALLALAGRCGVPAARFGAERERLAVFPFDSDRKRMSVVSRSRDGRRRIHVKGAPEAVVPLCTEWCQGGAVMPLDAATRDVIARQEEALTEKGLRVLAVAVRDQRADEAIGDATATESGLGFLGLVAMHDAPREGVREAIRACHDAGIRVVMITGDHPRTARAIATSLGLLDDGEVVAGPELERLDDDALATRVARIRVYARVTAAHKLRIVRAWRATGAVVAMTGDGVNDAPALEGADIGIAMGSGTDVTKSAADFVIVDDDFATIVAAIEEGRGIWANIRKTLLYLLAGNSGELLFMTASLVADLPVPLLPVHLLWINLVTDGLPALCLSTDPIDPDVMRAPPRHRRAGMIDVRFYREAIAIGVLTGSAAMAAYLLALPTRGVECARAHAFTTLVCAELLRAFGERSEVLPVWRVPFFGNLRLILVVGFSLALQVAVHQVAFLQAILRTAPIALGDGLRLLALAGVPLLAIELRKVFALRRDPRRRP